ncbi:MAG TPA: Sec-independent protein translocase subunit TatA [Porticoccaceae bacterium]|nr:Sec-independent protein translocase subunit TatA [Porticoccaceae bacterium]
MGLGGISIWQLLIILAIVLLIFGTRRLKNLGGDLGGAIKGFKDAVSSDEDEADDAKKDAENKDANAQARESAEQDHQESSGDKKA